MALSEETIVDMIEIMRPANVVQVRMATIIKRGDQEISRTFHRYALEAGADLTDQPAEVVNICKAIWS